MRLFPLSCLYVWLVTTDSVYIFQMTENCIAIINDIMEWVG